jgi:hypothetical protein
MIGWWLSRPLDEGGQRGRRPGDRDDAVLQIDRAQYVTGSYGHGSTLLSRDKHCTQTMLPPL